MRYDWKPNRRYVVMLICSALFWLQMLYTQLLYIYQHTIVRTCEVFAIYGVVMSVC